MSNFKLGLLAVFGAGLMMTACSSNTDKFVEDCTPSLIEEGLGEIAAKSACVCAEERLMKTLDKKQMALATKLIGMSSEDASEFISKTPGSDEILEAAEGAMKSCAM